MKSIFCVFFLISSIIKIQSQCTLPPLNIGNDTVLCQNQVLSIQIDNMYLNSVWSNGTLGNSITITQPGLYEVVSTVPGGNIIVNGDFELGNTNFTTNYTLGSVSGGGSVGLLTNPQTYEITTSPSLVHNNFPFCSHDGNMMVVNSAEVAGQKVWCQTVNTDPNTLYTISAEFANTINYNVVPDILFFVNTTQIGSVYSTSDFSCDWGTYTATWNSGTTTSANVCFYNLNIEGVGNDFAVDNISMIPNCKYIDEIQVDYDQITYSLVDSLVFCSDLPEELVLETFDTDLSYLWSTGETNDTISPTISAYHFLTITSGNNCVYKDSTFVEILTTPLANFTYTQVSEDTPFEVLLENQSSNATSISWDFGNGISDNQLNSSTQYYQIMGDYMITLIAENGVCNDTIVKTIALYNEVKIPNIFTPNNDTQNDLFFIKNLNKDEFEITILNRWGQVVFESDDIKFTWDGKDQSGKECISGTYFYQIYNRDYTGEKKYYQGNVQLIKD